MPKHRSQRLFMVVLLLLLPLFCLAQQSTQSATSATALSNIAILLNVKSAIGPASQDFIQRGIEQANKQRAQLIIVQLDTPGGLETSMHGIIRDILASPVPVVVYVAPSGARAASAGTYILYASSVAAMAPGTNIGAATPVDVSALGGSQKKSKTTMETKALHDAQAYIRSLAQLRHRNEQWAEQAVTAGVSLSANEALKLKVIDLIANNIPDLLTQLNGRSIDLQGKTQVLQTQGLVVEQLQPDWRIRLLSIVTDPSIAYILLMIGMWGLFFEFVNPGFVLPGVTGAICLLLALYGFELLPINYAGLALLLLGVGFMVAEVFIGTFGVLGVGGVIALFAGSILLLERGTPGFQIALPLIFAVCAVTVMFFLVIINLAVKSRLRPVVSGREELIGASGTVVMDKQGTCWIRVHGELWQGQSTVALTHGEKVKVIDLHGLVLSVMPDENQ